MQITFRIVYAAAVAILVVLFVVLGTLTFYPDPHSPWDARLPNPSSQEKREFQIRVREYEDDRADHSRNVFIAASILGAAAIVAGLSLFRRIQAIPLGVLLGGFGVVLFGWIRAGGEFDEMGPGPPFIAVSIGLAAVLTGGFYFLKVRSDAEA